MFSCDYMTDFMPGMSGRLTAAAWLEVLGADAHSRSVVGGFRLWQGRLGR
jgi:hypothetical protein